LQEGGIPLWVAGSGEKKTLRTAAKYAGYTNFDAKEDSFRHKSEVLAAHCRDVGTDFDAIVRSSNFEIVIGETEKDVQERLDWIRAHYAPFVTPERLQQRMDIYEQGLTTGTPERIAEQLTKAHGFGMGYAILNFVELAYDRSGLELFLEKVVPELPA